MDSKTSLYASHPHRFANVSERDLRVRAIGQIGAIATLLAPILVATVMSGCDPIAPVGASSNAGDASSAPVASNATPKAGFDWRRADPVQYTDEEWKTPDDPMIYY